MNSWTNLQNDSGQRPPALSLSQYTAAIGSAVRLTPQLHNAWIVAELSDVRVSGGHCYMELIEKNGSGQTIAKIRATIWANTFQTLRRKFYGATGRDIATGMKVMLNGSANHHSLYGLSFTVSDIDPSYTMGDLERLRREILARLQSEGILDLNKTLEMPPVPQKIAVVSAEGAAGYGDFINHLGYNTEGFVFYPFLFPAVMQGERTSSSVREALSLVLETKGLVGWDCVAIIRGGGATTDLNGFDEYGLAECVARFPLPVIVGIGHERDRTVLDEIAHTRCKTPTAVASYLTDRVRESYERTAAYADWAARYASDRVGGEKQRIANIEAMVPALLDARLTKARSFLEKEMARIPALVSSRISYSGAQLEKTGSILGTVAAARILRENQRLGIIGEKIRFSANNMLSSAKSKFQSTRDIVEALSPANTLRRGYSITRIDGKAVKDASDVAPGTVITTQLADGELVSVAKG